MSYLMSLSPDAKLLDVFRAYPATGRPLLDNLEALMRGPSPLSVANRELIAAYVSALNGCDYCHNIHRAAARAFGVDERTLEAIAHDPDGAALDDQIKPVLRYVAKLTQTPSRVTQADARAVYAAGWNDQALHDVASVCAMFNMINRIVNGLGINADEAHIADSARCVADIGYVGLRALI
jgi:uncharacterized peroxidase-related enzyme